MGTWTTEGRKPTHVSGPSPGLKLTLPYAHVLYGSIVGKTLHGFTRWHALGRAAKWAQRNGADGSLRVSRWSTST